MAVVGNCDFEDAEDELLFDFAGKKFLYATDTDTMWNTEQIFYRQKQREGADIVVFGHSHETFSEIINGALYINPGSLSLPRGGSNRGFAILEIDGESIKVKEIEI